MDNLTNSYNQDSSYGDKPSPKERLGNILSAFVPRKDYFFTPIIIDINIIIYLLMVISGVDFVLPNPEDLIKWGANYSPATLNGEPWRIITSCFLHFGIIHLAFNMFALASIGVLLEPLMGRVNFIVAYFLTGIAASMASLWWHGISVGVGASGAIFGLFGVFTAMLTTNLIEKEERKGLLKSMLIFIAYNLAFGMIGNIDNSAHIGGLLCGIALGYGFCVILKNKKNSLLSYGILFGMIAFVLLFAMFLYKALNVSDADYINKIKEFSFRKAPDQLKEFGANAGNFS